MMTSLLVSDCKSQRRRGLRKHGQDVAVFLQTAANFQQRRLWVIRVSSSLLKSPKIGDI